MKTHKIKLYNLIILFFLISAYSRAQKDSIDIYELNLTQLTKIKISSASKVSENINEIPATVYVITGQKIKENGYFTLEEVLSDLPGFQFRNPLGFNSYIFQRGIPNQNNLILLLIDGIQVNELNSGGFYAGGQYNLSNIERIEVIYGPSSVAYGTNAVSGIINIITKKASENNIELNSLIGNFNTYQTDVNYSYSGKNDNFGINIAAMVKKSDKANLKGAAGDYNWTDLMNNYENDYTFDIKTHYKNLIFGTNYIYKQTSTATYHKTFNTIYRDYGTSWNIQFINNYLKYETNISDKFNIYAVLYNRNSTVLPSTIYYVLDTAQVGYYRPNNLTGIETVAKYDFNSIFSLVGGLTFEYENLAKTNTYSFSKSSIESPPKPLKPKMTDNTLASFFIEPKIKLFKTLFLSGGARYDRSSYYDEVLTPRAGLSYQFKKHIFRVSYSEAFRAPKPWDYYDGIGNNSLLPEKMKSFEATLSFSLFKNYKLDFTAYSDILDNVLNKSYDNKSYKWINSGQINIQGLEAGFKYFSSKFEYYFNYSFNESTNEADKYIDEISKHSANGGLLFSFTDFIKINLRANYLGKRENPKIIASTNNKFIDPCIIFHSSLSFINYKGFTLQTSVKNILNKEYYHTSNSDPDRYRQPQRTFLLSLGYKINYLTK